MGLLGRDSVILSNLKLFFNVNYMCGCFWVPVCVNGDGALQSLKSVVGWYKHGALREVFVTCCTERP